MRFTIHFSVASSSMFSFSLRLLMLMACGGVGIRGCAATTAAGWVSSRPWHAAHTDARPNARRPMPSRAPTCCPPGSRPNTVPSPAPPHLPATRPAGAHLVDAAVVLKQELAGCLHEGILGGHQEEVGVQHLAGWRGGGGVWREAGEAGRQAGQRVTRGGGRGMVVRVCLCGRGEERPAADAHSHPPAASPPVLALSPFSPPARSPPRTWPAAPAPRQSRNPQTGSAQTR